MSNWFTRILAPGTTSETPPAETEEWFTPRTDGVYHGGPDAYRFIRFNSAQQVRITDADNAPALDNPTRAGEAVLAGSWTAAGRFSVSRPFQRPIVFVVTTMDGDQMTLRITDTTSGETSTHLYRSHPGI